MSLDVYLTLDEAIVIHSGIFIRNGGQMIEVSRVEWDRRFPGQEPVAIPATVDNVLRLNITHNLNVMAEEAGIYRQIWHPGKAGIEKASDLIVPLRRGLALLKSDPDRFREFNPANGWGNYETFVSFVEACLAACEAYPDAKVSVWR